MRTTVIAAGAIVVAAVAAVPYVSGRMFEQEVRVAIDGYNKRQSLVTASIVSYERRWLQSEFVTRVAVREGPEVARATTQLRHAPFTGVHLVSGQSEVHLPDTLAATENHYFGGQTPLTIDFDVELGGGASGIMRSAAIDKAVIATPNARVVASASSGRFSVDKDKTFKFDWTLPKATYEAPKVSLGVEAIAFSAYGQFGDDDLSEPSGFNVTVGAYRGVQGAQRTGVRNLSLSTKVTPSKETLRFAVAARAGAGEVALDANPYAWESFDLACSVADVPKGPVIKYSADLRNLSAVDSSDAQRVRLAMRALTDLAAGLAEGEPAFAVDRMELRTAQGNVMASMRIGIDKARFSASPSSWSAADGFVMSGHASIARLLAVRLVASVAGDDAAAQKAIAQFVARGIVREAGDALELDIAARDGMYMVNGVRATELARM